MGTVELCRIRVGSLPGLGAEAKHSAISQKGCILGGLRCSSTVVSSVVKISNGVRVSSIDKQRAQRPRFLRKVHRWAPLGMTNSGHLAAVCVQVSQFLKGTNSSTSLSSNGPRPRSALRISASESPISTLDIVPNGNFEPASSIEPQQEDEKIQRLREWLLELGWDDCGLAVLGGGVGDYAAYAKEGGVEEGDVIVRVPEAAIMTEEVRARVPPHSFFSRLSLASLEGGLHRSRMQKASMERRSVH